MSLITLFSQAFLSCDEEWAQHRKIIELSASKPLRRAVPSHFQYLSAEWGDPNSTTEKSFICSKGSSSSSGGGVGSLQGMAPYGGIVHPVESEHKIDTNFCLDVVAGLLDVEPMRMRRSSHKNAQNTNVCTASGVGIDKAVADFKADWSTFDWTQYM